MSQREPRRLDPGFLKYTRGLPCLSCGYRVSEAAHIRMASPKHNKRSTGMGEKPDDRWVVPLCGLCHRNGDGAQHKVGEEVFWADLGLDPCEIAISNYRDYGGAGGKTKGPRKIKKRRPPALRTKIASRPFQKVTRPTARKTNEN